jgi:putative hydrolase
MSEFGFTDGSNDGSKKSDEDALKDLLNEVIDEVNEQDTAAKQKEQLDAQKQVQDMMNMLDSTLSSMTGAGGAPTDGNMGQLMQQLFGAMNGIQGTTSGPSEQASYDLARKVAMRVFTQKYSGPVDNLSAGRCDEYKSAIQKSDLWLDAVTDFEPNREAKVRVITGSTWIEETLATWIKLGSPYINGMTQNTVSGLREQLDSLGDMLGDQSDDAQGTPAAHLAFNINGFGGDVPVDSPDALESMLTTLNTTMLSEQTGSVVGSLAPSVFCGTDYAYPFFNRDYVFIDHNIATYQDKDGVPENFMAYIVVREVTSMRLFNSAKWIGGYIQTLLENVADGVNLKIMDPSVLGDLSDIDLTDKENLEKIMKEKSDDLLKFTDSQQIAIDKLKTILALIEGWVDYVSFRAAVANIPEIGKMKETFLRRRLSGHSPETAFSKVIGYNIENRLYVEATKFWERYAAQQGGAGIDNIWRRPDSLPKALDEKSIENFLNGWNDDALDFDLGLL